METTNPLTQTQLLLYRIELAGQDVIHNIDSAKFAPAE